MADPIVMDQLFHSFLIFFNHLVRTEVDRNFCFETIRGNNYFPKEKNHGSSRGKIFLRRFIRKIA